MSEISNISYKKEKIGNLDYEIVNFFILYNSDDDCSNVVVFDEYSIIKKGINKKKCKLYILIPSWFEMQDIIQKSSEKNIMTKKYEINQLSFRFNKIRVLIKKIDIEGEQIYLTNDMIRRMNIEFASFVSYCVDNVISKYYVGTGLIEDEARELSNDCFKYYKSKFDISIGKNAVVPPCPSAIILMNICEIFNCTPDVARKIDRKDIEMFFIAKSQQEICNDPSNIGYSNLKRK